jgi:hypothetical protein
LFIGKIWQEIKRILEKRVDVQMPALRDWTDLRLVDTPGLGSTFEHNTLATKEWLPNTATALIVVSADRPLSDEERRLIAEVRNLAPRVWVVPGRRVAAKDAK